MMGSSFIRSSLFFAAFGVTFLVLAAFPHQALAACAGPAGAAGDVIYNSTQKIFQYCNDTNWVRMNYIAGSGSGSCTNPAAPEGSIFYNADERMLQGCAGNVWRGMTPKSGGGNEWVQVSHGVEHTCGIRHDGTLWCWGSNYRGALGNGTSTSWGVVNPPSQVSGGGTWSHVSAGSYYTCGIRSDVYESTTGSAGANYAGTAVNDNSVGGANSWSSVASATANDGSKATRSLVNSAVSNYIKATNFGFSIPSDATVRGISVEWEKQASGTASWPSRCLDSAVRIVKGGVIGTTDKTTSTNWTTTDNTYFSHGGSSDLWGETWTPDDINDPGFGAAIAATNPGSTSLTCRIDAVRITVHYSTPDAQIAGTAWCWGGNSSGQLGNGSSGFGGADSSVPVEIYGGGAWKYISTGSSNTCAIKSDDTLWCWGSRGSGRIGDGGSTSGSQTTPAAVSGGSLWKKVGIGGWNGAVCGIKDNDTLWCWGSSQYGQRGDGTTTTSQTTPVQVSGGGSWIDVGLGHYHTCGIKSDGTAWCWGIRDDGRIGDGGVMTGNQATPAQVSGAGTWIDIAAGGGLSCGVKSDKSAWCWGWAQGGALGNGATADSNVPVAVSGNYLWQYVSLGPEPMYIDWTDSDKADGACGLLENGGIRCWGYAEGGNSGVGSAQAFIPHPVKTSDTVWKAISAGGPVTCGIKASDDSMWCSGDNRTGQLGSGSGIRFTSVPIEVTGGGAWKQVSSGMNSGTWINTTCGIKSEDSIWCWGNGGNGQLGNGGTVNSDVPVQVSGGAAWKLVAAGERNICAIRSDDTLWCWGTRTNGAIGDGGATSGSQTTPIEVAGSSKWRSVSAGSYYACGIKADGTGWCWGDGGSGNLGNGDNIDSNVPVEISGGGTWKTISANAWTACGIKSDDTLWCWGWGTQGNLGNGSTSDSNVPVQVSGGGAWRDVSVAGNHACAIKADRTAWCWGRNDHGEVGDTTFTQRLVPTKVAGEGKWNTISTGINYYWYLKRTCALDAANHLWCWGNGEGGTFGSSEIGFLQVPTATDCVNPSRRAGAVIYNTAVNKLQFCDGAGWIEVGRQGSGS